MSAKPPPLVPNSVPIADVLQRTPALTQLRQRLQDSNARFVVVRGLLPPALAPHVKPGPVDDEGWSLLAANASVAAKLRQLQPRLEETLRERGWQSIAIRIKVQSS